MEGEYYIRLAGRGPLANSVAYHTPEITLGPQDPNDPFQVVGHAIELVVIVSVLTSLANVVVVDRHARHPNRPKCIHHKEHPISWSRVQRCPAQAGIVEHPGIHLVH